MTKTEMRDFAKEKLMEAIAVAYYKLENENFTQEEVEQITQYINNTAITIVYILYEKLNFSPWNSINWL